MKIKKTLTIAQEAEKEQDYMWELNFPFPYNNEEFIVRTMELNNGYDIRKYHVEMKTILNQKEFEYMIWQEWKEGFAQHVENLIRNKYGLENVLTALSQPFDRRHFYELGNIYIGVLINNDEKLNENIMELFYRMRLNN